MRKYYQAYSLIELMVVMAIIGVLSALLIPRLGRYQVSEFLKQSTSNLETNIKTAQSNATNGVQCGSSSNPVDRAKAWRINFADEDSYQLLPDCETNITEPVFNYNLPSNLTFKSIYFERGNSTCGAPLGSKISFANITGKVGFLNTGGCNSNAYDRLVIVIGAPNGDVRAAVLNTSGILAIADPIAAYPTLELLIPTTGPTPPLPTPLPTATPIPTPPPGVPAKRVFVTSSTFNGQLYDSFNFRCNEAATNAGLGGNWRAWISRINPHYTPSFSFLTKYGGPYRLINGTTIANNWSDLTDGILSAPINITELGTLVTGTTLVWTCTGTAGETICPSNYHTICLNWENASLAEEGIVGDSSSNNNNWTNYQSFSCNSQLHLYCFEQ